MEHHGQHDHAEVLASPLGPLVLDDQLDALVRVNVNIFYLLEGNHKFVAFIRSVEDQGHVEPEVVVQLFLL